MVDLPSITIAYVTFGGVLVGFAFTGLCIYLNQQPDSRERDDFVILVLPRRGEPLMIKPVPVSKVASAGFYAMASLAMATFVYADLAGRDKERANAAMTAMVLYGILLALSVLTLFYFVTLMMFEHPPTRSAARPAFWAVTIAGSVVTLRFLAGSARDAEQLRCPGSTACIPWIFSGQGILIVLLVAATAFILVTFSRILEWRRWRGILEFFMNRPDLPPLGVFVIAVLITTLASLYVNIQSTNNPPSDGLIQGSYWAGVLLVVTFALASGCVVYPRVHGDIRLRSADIITSTSGTRDRFSRMRSLSAAVSVLMILVATWIALFVESPKLANGVRVPSAIATVLPFIVMIFRTLYSADEDDQSVQLNYASGTRPSDRNRQFVWAVPARQASDATLITRFQINSVQNRIRMRGMLRASAINTDSPADNRREIAVTIIGSHRGTKIRKPVSCNGGSIELMDVIELNKELEIEVYRVDDCPETVLLYWSNPHGEIYDANPKDKPASEGRHASKR